MSPTRWIRNFFYDVAYKSFTFDEMGVRERLYKSTALLLEFKKECPKCKDTHTSY